MSELLALRREVVALRKKAERARGLETQNALLHLAIARAEQENLTLKRAVVILQRRLGTVEAETIEKATLLSECKRAPIVSSTSLSISGLSPSVARSQSLSSSPRRCDSPALLRMCGASLSPQAVPPHRVVRHGFNTLPTGTRSPLTSAPINRCTPSLLHTPPEKVRCHVGTSPRRNRFIDERSAKYCTSDAVENVSQVNVMSPEDGMEVSAITSLFSPLSHSGVARTPVSPRTVIPSPLPKSTLLASSRAGPSRGYDYPPMGHLPRAASRSPDTSLQ
jgi:predicted HTH domain antitoxin